MKENNSVGPLVDSCLFHVQMNIGVLLFFISHDIRIGFRKNSVSREVTPGYFSSC